MNLRVLIAVDGSAYSRLATEHVLRLADAQCLIDLHLLTVQMPLETGHIRQFIPRDQLEAHYRDSGLAALQEVVSLLDQRGQQHTAHIAVGHIAETITRYANEMNFELIVIGTHGRTGLRHVAMGSVAQEVLKRATVPVTVVHDR